MGTNLNYQGKAGCGQHAKMANQIMIAGTLSGVCEALTYAKAKGLDLETVLRSASTGAAGRAQLDALGAKILAGAEAESSGLHLEILGKALENYRALEAAGFGDFGTHVLMKHYEQ